jgi:putative Holliday junction resolvase
MNNEQLTSGRLAGIDHGTVRIGIALTDPRRTIASPHLNYTRRGEEQDGRFFRQLADQEQIVLFVVGLPVHLSGDESEQSHRARQFGQWLKETTKVPVEYFDERYSTVQAEQALAGARLTKKQRRKRRDMLAAQMMLTAYLESGDTKLHQPKPLED